MNATQEVINSQQQYEADVRHQAGKGFWHLREGEIEAWEKHWKEKAKMEEVIGNAMQSASIGKLAEALSKAQVKIQGAIKYCENPYFHSRYADLSAIWDACRAPLSEQGLAVIQTTEGTPDQVIILTTLAHSSGEWIRGRLALKPAKADPQGIGSAMTYGRRYALAAIVGVAPEDDDGNAASGGKREAAAPPKRPTPGVDQMLKTGQAVPAAPAKPEEKDPLRAIKTLMELSGVSVPELKKYLEGKGFIPAGGKVIDMDRGVYEQMIQDKNWAKVVEKIKAARKAA